MPKTKQVKILNQKVVYQGYIGIETFELQHELFQGGMSPAIKRVVCQRGEAVVILPYDPVKDAVLMVEQFRLPAYCKQKDPWLLELPAGVVDQEGESIEQVAAREMLEETGHKVTDLKLIHEFMPSPGILAEVIYIFVGRADSSGISNMNEVYGNAEEGEDIRLHVVPFSTIMAHLHHRVNSAPAMLGLYWLITHRDKLRKEWGF
jgi:ADP-ribose pyrophosphatase